MTANPYLVEYHKMLGHQIDHGGMLMPAMPAWPQRPWQYCFECLRSAPRTRDKRAQDDERTWQPMQRQYAWGIPDESALEAIAEHSPGGVVEIGAGGGYWAKLLRERGVDVMAFDADPGFAHWTLKNWSEVLLGDHTAVIGFPKRTLLLCWPSYDMPWTAEVLELYGGDTVIYVGEGSGGCTGCDRMHTLLGEGSECWHLGAEHDDPCDCGPRESALFTPGKEVRIPQWCGLNDYLSIYHRI